MTKHSCSFCANVCNRAACPTPALYAGLEAEVNDCPWWRLKPLAKRVEAVLAEEDDTELSVSSPFTRLQVSRMRTGRSKRKGIPIEQPKRKPVNMEDYLE